MSENYQAAVPLLPAERDKTRWLVATYHFMVAAFAFGAIAVSWIDSSSGEVDIPPLGFFASVLTLFGVAYVLTGLGILRWKKWSRISSLVLNWLNVVGAVWAVARSRVTPAGAINVFLSCLVLWWLSNKATKARFTAGGKTA